MKLVVARMQSVFSFTGGMRSDFIQATGWLCFRVSTGFRIGHCTETCHHQNYGRQS